MPGALSLDKSVQGIRLSTNPRLVLNLIMSGNAPPTTIDLDGIVLIKHMDSLNFYVIIYCYGFPEGITVTSDNCWW
jgi:hypothetical protein